MENHFGTKIKTLYSDNGGEFIALRSFLSSHGIAHLTSPPNTPEHNGVTERKHRHIVETGLNLLHQASLPPTYWTYSFVAAVYLINRLPSSTTAPLTKSFSANHQTTWNSDYLAAYALAAIIHSKQAWQPFLTLHLPWLLPYAKRVFVSPSPDWQNIYLASCPVCGNEFPL